MSSRFRVVPKSERTIYGICFDSKREAKRYQDLRLLELAGEISCLELQPRFVVMLCGKRLCQYTADTRYITKEGVTIVEDVKSSGTAKDPYYRLRKRAAEIYFGIHITEVIAK